jgi:hypothetical protein
VEARVKAPALLATVIESMLRACWVAPPWVIDTLPVWAEVRDIFTPWVVLVVVHAVAAERTRLPAMVPFHVAVSPTPFGNAFGNVSEVQFAIVARSELLLPFQVPLLAWAEWVRASAKSKVTMPGRRNGLEWSFDFMIWNVGIFGCGMRLAGRAWR